MCIRDRAWESAAPLRMAKDLESLVFAGASFASKPAKILGTVATAAQIGGVWSRLPPVIGTQIVEALQGTGARAGSEFGSKSPPGAKEKAAVVGMVTKMVGAVFNVVRMQAMAAGNTRIMLGIQAISTLVLSLVAFSMAFWLGLSSAIEAFGIGLGLSLIHI